MENQESYVTVSGKNKPTSTGNKGKKRVQFTRANRDVGGSRNPITTHALKTCGEFRIVYIQGDRQRGKAKTLKIGCSPEMAVSCRNLYSKTDKRESVNTQKERKHA